MVQTTAPSSKKRIFDGTLTLYEDESCVKTPDELPSFKLDVIEGSICPASPGRSRIKPLQDQDIAQELDETNQKYNSNAQ